MDLEDKNEQSKLQVLFNSVLAIIYVFSLLYGIAHFSLLCYEFLCNLFVFRFSTSCSKFSLVAVNLLICNSQSLFAFCKLLICEFSLEILSFRVVMVSLYPFISSSYSVLSSSAVLYPS